MGSETNIPTLMFRNPIFDGEREEYRYVDYSLWLYIQQPDTTTSGWQRRRKTGDQVRLPLPWCLDLNTHNHERRRETGDQVRLPLPWCLDRKDPQSQTKRPTITDGLDPAVEEEDDDVKNLFAEMNDATCRRWRSTKEICHLQKMNHQGNSRIAITELMIMLCNQRGIVFANLQRCCNYGFCNFT